MLTKSICSLNYFVNIYIQYSIGICTPTIMVISI